MMQRTRSGPRALSLKPCGLNQWVLASQMKRRKLPIRWTYIHADGEARLTQRAPEGARRQLNFAAPWMTEAGRPQSHRWSKRQESDRRSAGKDKGHLLLLTNYLMVSVIKWMRWYFSWFIDRAISRYHVVKEVNGPVEGLADARDVLQPLGAAVLLADDVDGEAGCCDGVACDHTYGHEDLEDGHGAVKTKWDHSRVVSRKRDNSSVLMNRLWASNYELPVGRCCCSPLLFMLLWLY